MTKYLSEEARFRELHAKGLSNAAISKELGIGTMTVTRWRKRFGLKPSRIIPVRQIKLPNEEISKEIIYLYKQGISQNEICRQFGLTFQAFHRMATHHGFEVRGRPKHSLDSGYFDNIDTFYKAYFLGWLASDGSIGYTRNQVKNRGDFSKLGRVNISIQERDGYILDKLREEIKFSGEVDTRDKGPGRQRQKHLGFCDQKMAQSIYKRGLTDNKSFTFAFPDIPEEFFWAFVLGYFDGDGCVCMSKVIDRGYHSIKQYWGITCSKTFAETLGDILLSRYSIKTHIIKKKCQNGYMYTIKTGDRDAMKRLYHYLYDNAPFCLQRKKEKMEDIFRQLNLPL